MQHERGDLLTESSNIVIPELPGLTPTVNLPQGESVIVNKRSNPPIKAGDVIKLISLGDFLRFDSD